MDDAVDVLSSYISRPFIAIQRDHPLNVTSLRRFWQLLQIIFSIPCRQRIPVCDSSM
jgi:hypothetical protein